MPKFYQTVKAGQKTRVLNALKDYRISLYAATNGILETGYKEDISTQNKVDAIDILIPRVMTAYGINDGDKDEISKLSQNINELENAITDLKDDSSGAGDNSQNFDKSNDDHLDLLNDNVAPALKNLALDYTQKPSSSNSNFSVDHLKKAIKDFEQNHLPNIEAQIDIDQSEQNGTEDQNLLIKVNYLKYLINKIKAAWKIDTTS